MSLSSLTRTPFTTGSFGVAEKLVLFHTGSVLSPLPIKTSLLIKKQKLRKPPVTFRRKYRKKPQLVCPVHGIPMLVGSSAKTMRYCYCPFVDECGHPCDQSAKQTR